MAQSLVLSQPSPHVVPERVMFYLLGVGAVGGLAYLGYEYIQSMKDKQENNNNPVIPLPSPQVKPKNGVTWTGDSFPLKKGSKGPRVTQLHEALARIIGSAAMDRNGGIDDKFGNGTSTALKLAGYPASIDETTFNNMVTGVSNKPGATPADPALITAKALYNAAHSQDIERTLNILKAIKDKAGYTTINSQYKELRGADNYLLRATIVTDLLDNAYPDNESAKTLIKAEFTRMGLKLNPTTGKWSLDGVMLIKKAIVTIIPTWVMDIAGNTLTVNRSVILGEALHRENGYTWFKSIDNVVAKVPTSDITYYSK